MFEDNELHKPYHMLNKFILNYGSMCEALYLINVLTSNSRSKFFKKNFEEAGLLFHLEQVMDVLTEDGIEKELKYMVIQHLFALFLTFKFR